MANNYPIPVSIISGGGGTVTNDGTFAKESGGNLAAAKTDLDTINTNTAPYGTVTPEADITVSSSSATALTAIAGQRGVYVFNNDASIAIRWGDGTVTATKGARIPAGTGLFIPTSVAISLFAESGSPVASYTAVK